MSRQIKFRETDDKTLRRIEREFRKRLGEKEYRQKAFHAAAFTFLMYNFDSSQYNDTILTNLRNLLRAEFNAGAASVRKAKRRAK